MKIIDTEIKGLKVIELKRHGDARGFFVERYKEDVFTAGGIPNNFVQDNHSRSAPGILRGLHYQTNPTQGKLVGVTRGAIYDVAVDIRKNSPSYGKWFGIELTDENMKLLWVPAGFAHGFCVIGSETADVVYKVDGLYNPANEGGILWNDPSLGIKWPVGNPSLSGRDQKLSTFADYSKNPVF